MRRFLQALLRTSQLRVVVGRIERAMGVMTFEAAIDHFFGCACYRTRQGSGRVIYTDFVDTSNVLMVCS
jgi:hypothetical protein